MGIVVRDHTGAQLAGSWVALEDTIHALMETAWEGQTSWVCTIWDDGRLACTLVLAYAPGRDRAPAGSVYVVYTNGVACTYKVTYLLNADNTYNRTSVHCETEASL
jgi:hypothetical protein